MRLGRIASGQAKGPGLFLVLPCIDEIKVIDMRTVTFDVYPQEVSFLEKLISYITGFFFLIFRHVGWGGGKKLFKKI
jgi:erythrocyte band 7 integral membrane protein